MTTIDQNQKEAGKLRVLGKIRLSNQMLSFFRPRTDERDLMGFGITLHTPTKPASQTHEVGFVEIVIVSVQATPPQAQFTNTASRRAAASNAVRFSSLPKTTRVSPVSSGRVTDGWKLIFCTG